MALPLERKQAALLAWLHAEGPTPRARMALLLWPEADEERGRANLRQRLAKLRALDPDLLDDDGRVLALAPGLAIETGDEALLSTFDYADCEAFAQWLDQQRQSHQTRRRAGLARQARAAIEAGDVSQAQQHAEALLLADPESEDAHRLLMEALYLRGAYAEAITVWDRCRSLLRQLYGVPPSPATQALGDLILKAAQTHRAASLSPRDAMPLSLLRPPRLIGRSRSLDALLAGWYAGQVLCVSGSAGLGKSRLLAELAAATAGAVTATARPGDSDLPYAALGRLVLAALDRCPEPPDPLLLQQAARLLPAVAPLAAMPPEPLITAHHRDQALQACCALLQQGAENGCGGLILDDLHWADLASVEALPALLACSEPALRLAFGERRGEESVAAMRVLDDLARQGRLTRIELDPLGQAEVTALLASLALPGVDIGLLAVGLRRRVGGNPAFLLEALKLLLSLGPEALAHPELLPVAPGIESVVRRRVDLLTPQARQVAQLAAVAGPTFGPGLVGQVLGLEAGDLEAPMRELELRQVLYGRRFVHDLVASAVLQATPADTARHLHRGVARALQAQDGDAVISAGHWRACEDWLQAGRSYVASAEVARQALRPVERSQRLDAAIDCLQRADAQAELFDAIETRLNVAEAPDHALTRGQLTQRLQELARTPDQELRALAQRVGWSADQGRQDGYELGLQGMERALALNLPERAFGFLSGVAWQLAMRGHAAQAIATVDRHRAWVLTQGPKMQGEFHLILAGVLGYSDQLSAAIASGEDALATLRAAGRLERTLPVLNNIGLFRWWRGELDAAKATLLEASVLRDRMHGSGTSLMIDMYLGAVLRDRGEYSAAHALLSRVAQQFHHEAEALGPQADLTDSVMVENQLADLWLRLGRLDDARACLRTADVGSVDPRFQARRAGLQLRMARLQGKPLGQALAQGRALAAQLGSAFNKAWLELELGRDLAPTEALAEFVRLADEAPVRQRPGMALHAALRAGQAALACGRPDAARFWCDRAASLCERCQPFDMNPAEVSLILGQLLAADGQAAAARQCWQDGAQWLRRTAAHQLDAAWQEGFLQRHPIHGALLQAADGA